MALRKIIQIEGDAFINAPEGRVELGRQKSAFTAYCKVISLMGDKSKITVTVECADQNYKRHETYEIPVSVAEGSGNFVKQTYEHLKTLPEWADATDC
jgi:hypothetical protein